MSGEKLSIVVTNRLWNCNIWRVTYIRTLTVTKNGAHTNTNAHCFYNYRMYQTTFNKIKWSTARATNQITNRMGIQEAFKI